ncbi:hypothetical protein DFH06DRAFT_1428573 [Mycena polygramma]|nr:hypothetical protein DFH06DRAFT_1428573 [Mycena polygramma]
MVNLATKGIQSAMRVRTLNSFAIFTRLKSSAIVDHKAERCVGGTRTMKAKFPKLEMVASQIYIKTEDTQFICEGKLFCLDLAVSADIGNIVPPFSVSAKLKLSVCMRDTSNRSPDTVDEYVWISLDTACILTAPLGCSSQTTRLSTVPSTLPINFQTNDVQQEVNDLIDAPAANLVSARQQRIWIRVRARCHLRDRATPWAASQFFFEPYILYHNLFN